jgi:hypothetical protein
MGRSQATIELARRLGRKPGTLEGHRRREMWPAKPGASLERHYQVMDACGIGPGRDDWVVAIEAAIDHEWPIVKLRSVLSDPPPIDATRLGQRVLVLVGLLVQVSGMVDDYRDGGTMDTTTQLDRPTKTLVRREPFNDVVEGARDDIVSGNVRAMLGQETESADFNSTGELISSLADRAIAIGVPDSGGEAANRPFADEVRNRVLGMSERSTSWLTWAEKASPDELAHAVKLASKIVDLLDELSPHAVHGDQRFREIAWFSGWCGAELVPMDFGKFLSPLEDLMLSEKRQI